MNRRNSHTMLITRYKFSEFSLNSAFLCENAGITPLKFVLYPIWSIIDSARYYICPIINIQFKSKVLTVTPKAYMVNVTITHVICYLLSVMCNVLSVVFGLIVTNNYNSIRLMRYDVTPKTITPNFTNQTIKL